MKWVLLINGKNNYSIRNNTATQDVGFCHHTMCVRLRRMLGLEMTTRGGSRVSLRERPLCFLRVKLIFLVSRIPPPCCRTRLAHSPSRLRRTWSKGDRVRDSSLTAHKAVADAFRMTKKAIPSRIRSEWQKKARPSQMRSEWQKIYDL